MFCLVVIDSNVYINNFSTAQGHPYQIQMKFTLSLLKKAHVHRHCFCVCNTEVYILYDCCCTNPIQCTYVHMIHYNNYGSSVYEVVILVRVFYNT